MPERPDAVSAVIRHREAVLLCRESERTGDPPFPTAALGDGPPEAALEALLERLGFGAATVERGGQPVETAEFRSIPFLATATERGTPLSDDCPGSTWDSPTTLLRTADGRWWPVYQAVAPTAETVGADTERGSTAIAVDALWALRDAAARAAANRSGLGPVVSAAEGLIEARPSMAALGNRVNRVMAGAATPEAVETAATEGIIHAHEADEAAAREAAEVIDGGRVLTLSRSGTVRDALLEARPAVDVLASRPGGEGFEVASELAAAGLTVSIYPDARGYDRLRSGEIDAVLVGADAVTPDGGVINKVGTRAAALAAALVAVPFYVVCASDKIRPAGEGGSSRIPGEPMFDETPPELVTAVLTERGRLTPEAVAHIADANRELAQWRDE